jgi:hypothetical protein
MSFLVYFLAPGLLAALGAAISYGLMKDYLGDKTILLQFPYVFYAIGGFPAAVTGGVMSFFVDGSDRGAYVGLSGLFGAILSGAAFLILCLGPAVTGDVPISSALVNAVLIGMIGAMVGFIAGVICGLITSSWMASSSPPT